MTKNKQGTGRHVAGMRRKLLLPLFYDMIFPVAGYYGLRYFGVHPFTALVLSILPAAGFQLYQIAKNREADFLGLFILGIIFFSVSASFITGSARFMLAKSGWVTGVIGLLFWVSLFLKRPLAFIIAQNMMERFMQLASDFDALWKDEPDFRHAWKVSTGVWGGEC